MPCSFCLHVGVKFKYAVRNERRTGGFFTKINKKNTLTIE